MRDIPPLSHDFLPGGGVIAFIERQMLSAIRLDGRPRQHNGFQRLAEQLIIVYIGRSHYNA